MLLSAACANNACAARERIAELGWDCIGEGTAGAGAGAGEAAPADGAAAVAAGALPAADVALQESTAVSRGILSSVRHMIFPTNLPLFSPQFVALSLCRHCGEVAGQAYRLKTWPLGFQAGEANAVVLYWWCSEGDNLQDGSMMAQATNEFLALLPGREVKWRAPPSWRVLLENTAAGPALYA